MKLSLGTKIMGSFALIVLVSLGLSVGFGNRLLRTGFDDYALRRDQIRAQFLAPLLGFWVDNSQNQLSPLVMPMRDRDGRDPRDRDDRVGVGPMRGMMGMMGRLPINEDVVLDQVLITDTQGRVLADMAFYGRSQVNIDSVIGEAIYHGGEVVGYLYVGRMIPGGPGPGEFSYFRAVGNATWFATAGIFLIALGMGALLTAHIVRPVHRLRAAALKVGSGNLTVRVDEHRRDELGELARSFNAMASSLEDSDQRRRRFISDSAHELRTPISLIRTRIEMIEEGVYPFDDASLSALASEADRLTNLVEELRSLADLESPESRMTLEDFSIPSLVRNVVEAAGPALDSLGLQVGLRTPDTPVTARGDRTKLHQVLTNILANARRHAEHRILVDTQVDEQNWIVTVEDDGHGVPEDQRESIFERFYRIDGSRSRDTGGSGLGLAICRSIALAHGGSIRCEAPKELSGARFIVTVPLNPRETGL